MSRIRLLDQSAWPSASSGHGPYRHLYIIQEGDTGPVKIGVAANASSRRVGLQAGNPRPIHLRAVFQGADKRWVGQIERATHAHFSPARIVNEWFDASPAEIIAFITESFCS